MKYTYVKVGQCSQTRITTQGYLTEQFLFIYIYIYIYTYICVTHWNVWESMGKLCSCMQFIFKKTFLLQVTREFVSVLQVTQYSSIALYYCDTCIIFSTLPCYHSNRWVLSSTYRQEVVHSVHIMYHWM